MPTLERLWYGRHPLAWVLAPLSVLFSLAVWSRRQAYRIGLMRSERPPVPVVVVGNISVGGTGKTPITIAVVEALAAAGWRPGVISRGYGAPRPPATPLSVTAATGPEVAGDEPVLIARRCGVPVVVHRDRVRAARALLAEHPCDVLVSDDGLQHYALARDVELAVVDAGRGHGNGLRLPAGPLRESPRRLGEVDAVIHNGDEGAVEGERNGVLHVAVTLEPGSLRDLHAHRAPRPLSSLAGREVHAVCGIGDPERFFRSLRAAGLRIHVHPRPDHHRFVAADLTPSPPLPVLITEKDAVKCAGLAPDAEIWVLPVAVRLPVALVRRLEQRLGPAPTSTDPADGAAAC